MVLLEFAMSPGGKGESLSPYVARIIDVIDRSGVPYMLTPMGTVLEGEWEQVMGVVGACFRELEKDCQRISLNLKMDYRAGAAGRMRSKVATIEQRLGRQVSKG